MNRPLAGITTVLLGCWLQGCQPPAAGEPATEELEVAATFSILGDLVGRVGGEDITLTVLVPAGSDPHNFVPSPGDFAIVARAELVIAIGAGFEPWLDDLTRGRRFQGRLVETATGLDLITDRWGEPDPHVWLDVQQAATMVATLRDALIELAPEREEAFRRRASRLLGELGELDTRIEQSLAQIPPERRRVVTAHDSLAYYARRYGIEVVGTVLHSHSTETGDPSAAHLARLVEAIRRTGAVAVFPDNVHVPPLLDRVAGEAGVPVASPLPTGSLEPDGPAATYIGLMELTTRRLVETLR